MSELRGSVLDVVRTLRDENDWDAVLAIVGKLVAENADMSRRLAQVKRSFKTSEKIGRAQLVLYVDALARGESEPDSDEGDADGPDELDEADAKLRTASGIDDKKEEDEIAKRKTRPPREPANRSPAPKTRAASTTLCSSPRPNGRVLAAARSARASATTSAR